MNSTEQKHTPFWAWILFLISINCYMMVFFILFMMAADCSDVFDILLGTVFHEPAVYMTLLTFLIPAIGSEYLIRNQMNRNSRVLKIFRWILILIYSAFTILIIGDTIIESLKLSLISIFALVIMIGIVVSLIYPALKTQKNK